MKKIIWISLCWSVFIPSIGFGIFDVDGINWNNFCMGVSGLWLILAVSDE